MLSSHVAHVRWLENEGMSAEGAGDEGENTRMRYTHVGSGAGSICGQCAQQRDHTDMKCSIPSHDGRPPPSATCLAKRRTMYLLDLAVADSTSLGTNYELLPSNPAAVPPRGDPASCPALYLQPPDVFNSLSQQARREGHACMLTDLQSCLPNLLYHLTLLTLTVPRISLLSTRKQNGLTSHITHSTTAMDNPKVLHELDNGFVVRAWVRSNNLIASTNDVLTAGGAIE